MAEDDALDALYRGPLGDFVERRKELAASLRKAGDKEGAATVAALPKPTPAAWVVNVLWSERGKDLEALLDLGERLREALRASFSGRGDGREAATLQGEQRSAIDRLAHAARDRLSAAGAPSSQAVIERVASTLRAIATTGSWGDAVPGRLAKELDTPDLATLASLLLAEGSGRAERPARARASATPPRAGAPKSESRPMAGRPAKGASTEAEGGAKAAERARHAQHVARAEAALERATEREKASRDAAERAAAVAARTGAERDEAAAEVAAARRAAEEAEEAARAARQAADAAHAAIAGTEKKLAAAERRHAEADERARRAGSDAAEAREAREAARAALAETKRGT